MKIVQFICINLFFQSLKLYPIAIYLLFPESSWLLLAVGKFHKGGDGSRGPFFGCFEGGVSLNKEPSGFAVHLISLRNSSETSDRGAISMAKRNL
jgi:hypothetical protein